MRIVGYELVPQSDFNDKIMSFGQSTALGISPEALAKSPRPATPVYADDDGNEYVYDDRKSELSAMPFLSGTPLSGDTESLAELGRGGFMPLPGAPLSGSIPLEGQVFGGIAKQLPPEMATRWLGGAAKASMLASAPGGAQDRVFSALGMPRPGDKKRRGPASDGDSGPDREPDGGNGQGKFSFEGLLPDVAKMFQQGTAAGLGQAGIKTALQAAGLDFPGAEALGNVLGGTLGRELGNQLGGLLDGMDLGGLTDQLGGLLPDGFAPTDSDAGELSAEAMKHIVPGGCVPGKSDAVDYKKLGADSLDKAADEMLKEWKVDDESSAAESIAHKVVNDNKEQLKEAAKDPSGVWKKIKSYFSGRPAGTGEWAVRIGDLDDKGDVSVMGVGNILFQGQSVSRMSDMVAGPLAPPPGIPISQGKATVKSAGLATAFRTAKTFVVSEMLTGAPTILVGGDTATLAPPAPANSPANQINPAPGGPNSPAAGKGVPKERPLNKGERKKVEGAIAKLENSDFGKTPEGKEVVATLKDKLAKGEIVRVESHARGAAHYGPGDGIIHLEDSNFNNELRLAAVLAHEATHAVDHNQFPYSRNSIENEIRAFENQVKFLRQYNPDDPLVKAYDAAGSRKEFGEWLRKEYPQSYANNTDGRYPAPIPGQRPTKPRTPQRSDFPKDGLGDARYRLAMMTHANQMREYEIWRNYQLEQQFERERERAFQQHKKNNPPPKPKPPKPNPKPGKPSDYRFGFDD